MKEETRMKKLPEVNVRYGDLYQMLIAPIRSKLLLTGIELKVFNELSAPTSADTVAKALGTHPRNTRVFLDSLAAIDLLHKKNGLYRNAPIAQTLLVETSPTYLGRLFTFMKPDDQFLQTLPTLVKNGPPPPPDTPPFSEEALAEGVTLMADVERAGYAQEAVNILVALPEFPSFQKMLDLGGGPGLIGMAIVDAHPTMTGVIFDLPPVVKETTKFIQEYEMAARMTVLAGDFNQDPIGEGYDLVWACGVLQFAVDIDVVLKKVYTALNPRGVFVSLYPFGQTHEHTKPESIVLSLLSMALMGQEVPVDHGGVADSMRRAGFTSVRSQDIETFMGPMELDIGRK
jgi:ubiquinone/menaquinone biosynthesis C-methylase UbiE